MGRVVGWGSLFVEHWRAIFGVVGGAGGRAGRQEGNACVRAFRRPAAPPRCLVPLPKPRRPRLPWAPTHHNHRTHPSPPPPTPAPPADLDKGQIIATATLVVELKFIRGCSKCGHIEDVVVDSTYRGLRLGLRVIEALMAAAEASTHARTHSLTVSQWPQGAQGAGLRRAGQAPLARAMPGHAEGGACEGQALLHAPRAMVSASRPFICLIPLLPCSLPACLQAAGCYKVILDCSEDNVPFYAKCGLTKKEVQMVR